jgi:predicted secreted hydrolase
MKKWRFVFIIIALFLATTPSFSEPPKFKSATPGRILNFPADHGKHPDFKTEWWYFTGNVKSPEGIKFGFQLTFFRVALFPGEPVSKSSWAVRDLYPAHFAITNITDNKFFFVDLLSREGPGLSQASSADLDVSVKNWFATREEDKIKIFAKDKKYKIELTLTPVKPLVLHGDKGYSRKATNETQASYYYSFTRMAVKGNLTFNGRPSEVTGSAWMDHEFGSSILTEMQTGWDWFSLQLNDNTEIMISYLRRRDNSIDRPFGTLIKADGTTIDLHEKEIQIIKMATWTSPNSKAIYPSQWNISIPDLNLKVNVIPAIANQELITSNSTGIAYWEGSVIVNGTREGKPVEGLGYAELTGYAASMGGLL